MGPIALSSQEIEIVTRVHPKEVRGEGEEKGKQRRETQPLGALGSFGSPSSLALTPLRYLHQISRTQSSPL
ncbi:hypothetical protein MUK42_35311 [Musa troglodytarum]|uniref:Uncharacterized protein n=1 Tax=Musa troglodytarum TaxID=320322 RepID=A0A9E7FI08_9LILI|nr:hypothetical protein MUK42_35311 [Musa troglodytarum]